MGSGHPIRRRRSSASSCRQWVPATWNAFLEETLRPALSSLSPMPRYRVDFFPASLATCKMKPLKSLFVNEFRKSAGEITKALAGRRATGTKSNEVFDYAGSYVIALRQQNAYVSAAFIRRHHCVALSGDGADAAATIHELLWAVTDPAHRGSGCAAAMFDIILNICSRDSADALLVISVRKAVGFWLKMGLHSGNHHYHAEKDGARRMQFVPAIVRTSAKSLTESLESKKRAALTRELLSHVDVLDAPPPDLALLLLPVRPRFEPAQTTHLYWKRGESSSSEA